MNKKTFRIKIESGICTTYGSCSFYKSGGQYYYGRYGEKGRETEVFGSFSDLWNAVSHYFVYGVDYLNRTVVDPYTKRQNENQNERWMRIHNLKLCKCDVRISTKQKTCSFCIRWVKLNRNHRQYVKIRGSISLYNKHPKQRRLITKKQEQTLRLCHQDFEGLTQEEAAEQMGTSHQAISGLLVRVKKIFPQYFPIFTKFEMKCYYYYMVDGWSVADIAEYVECASHTIYRALQRVRNKGAYFAGPTGRVLSYDASTDDENEGMDAQVIQKF